MRSARCSLFLAAIALALTACGRQQATDPHAQQAATTPATALAPPATQAVPTATPTQRQEAGLAPTPGKKAAATNEDGSETVEETTGDTGAHNPILAAVASTMAAGSAAAAAAVNTSPPPIWQEGTNYTRLVPAQPTAAPPGQVEVLEFFWYGCPHCYALDPQIEAWRKTKPAFISFARVPAMWSEGHRATARLYYTLESMGKLDQLHGEVFKEIHVNGNSLVGSDPNDPAAAERVQAAFLKKFGISEADYAKNSHSFAVETDLQRADQLNLRYRVTGVPSFVINGKYVADAASAGSPERLMSLVDDLANQEHKH